MSTTVPVAKARFSTPKSPELKPFDVHFNPVSLQYAVSNTLKEEGSGKTKKQFVTQGTGKLTMDLIFDNTSDGQDVRLMTMKIAKLMEPNPKASSGKKQVPFIVLFEWGSYKFQGMIESYKETLDFFAPKGVPLRATVNITLAQQDKIFEAGSADTSGTLTPDVIDHKPDAGSDMTSIATMGGDPSASRALASLNEQPSMRFPAGASVTVSGSIKLAPPAAFASGGAGIGGGAGFGIGGGVGVGISAEAGIGFGAGASAAFGIEASASGGISFGGSASAGVSASEGAFAGLRVSTQANSLSLDINRFLQVSDSVSVSTDSRATFQIGGQATTQASAGLTADVFASADLRARIQFEG